MRKTDLIIVVAVVTVGAAWWQQKDFSPSRPTPTPTLSIRSVSTPLTTSSGRWSVLPNRYQLAGLAIGMSESEIVAKLGQPTQKNQDNAESSTWSYLSDGAELHLGLLEGRLIMAGGTGRWALTEGQEPLPGFQSSQDQILTQFGEPNRQDDGAWVYTNRPGELTFHFQQFRVSQVLVTGEIAPQKLSK